MDFIKAQPPRPPSSSINSNSLSSSLSLGSSSLSSGISGSNDDEATADTDPTTGRANEPFAGLVSSTFKDLYDYIALEGANAGLFLGADSSLFNDTFLELNANLISGGLSNGTATGLSLLTSNTTAVGLVGLVAAATLAANGTTEGPSPTADVQARGLQDTIGGGGGGVGQSGDSEDEFSDVIITAVTSIILGLMILITVIGEANNRIKSC